MKLEIVLYLCFLITGVCKSSASFSESSNQSCPIWTTPKMDNGTIGCECGSNLNLVVICETKLILLFTFYSITVCPTVMS